MSDIASNSNKDRHMTTREAATMSWGTSETADRTDDACLLWLWRELYASDGVSAVCPKCRTVRKFHRVSGRRAFACGHCGSHVYPTVGTIFARSKLSLPTWFRAVQLILTSGGRMSARRLEAELAVSYAAALRIRKKVLAAMKAGGGPAALLTKLAQGADPPSTESESLPTRAGTQTASRTMESIRAAACRAFAERGLSSTRIADIAREAGVSSAIIHYYFKSKEQVLLAALQWAGEQHDKRVTQILIETSDHVERLRRFLDITVPRDGILRDEYILWLEVWVALRNHPELLAECDAMSRRSYDFIAELIEDGVRAGAFAPVASCQAATERIVAMRDGLGYRCVIGYRGMDGTNVHRVLGEFVAQLLGLPASALGVLGEAT
jgi:AcrR family transcriptional regulator/transposase-like protein